MGTAQGPPADARRAHTGPPAPPGVFTALWTEATVLITTMARLLTWRWLPLLVLALAGAAAHLYLRELAVVLGRVGAVPGLLVLALVPFSTLLTLIGMLLVLRRRVRSRTTARDLIAALGGVLLPYLVVYQSGGGLTDDLQYHMRNGVMDDLDRLGATGASGTPRVPDATSAVVLTIVAVALVMRLITERLAERDSLWRDDEDPRRMVLRVIAGYCELVWIVIGAFVLTYLLGNLAAWWRTRAVVYGFGQWWADWSGSWPALAGVAEFLAGAAGTLVAAAATALAVPLAWLLVGVLIYGIRAAEVAAAAGLPGVGRSGVLGAMARDARVQRSWQRISEPRGRFGVLIGAAGLVSRAGWALIGVYCLAYVLLSAVPYLIWAVLRALLPGLDALGWQSWQGAILIAIEVCTVTLSAVLLAAAADRLLFRFGAPSGLRPAPVRAPRSRRPAPARAPGSRRSAGRSPAGQNPAGQNPADQNRRSAATRQPAAGQVSAKPAVERTPGSGHRPPPPESPPAPHLPE